ncbi:hypothetical protein FALCPG4_002823 [Fusarium falciforme]
MGVVDLGLGFWTWGRGCRQTATATHALGRYLSYSARLSAVRVIAAAAALPKLFWLSAFFTVSLALPIRQALLASVFSAAQGQPRNGQWKASAADDWSLEGSLGEQHSRAAAAGSPH